MTDRKPLTKDEVLGLKPHDRMWIETNFGFGNCWCEIDVVRNECVFVVMDGPDGRLVCLDMTEYNDTRFFAAWRLWTDEPDEKSRWEA